MLLPALNRAKASAKSAKCISNAHQLGISAQLYWDDNKSRTFPAINNDAGLTSYDINRGTLYWFGWMENKIGIANGNVFFDPTVGSIYPYLKGRGVTFCPSFNYNSPTYMPKAAIGASFGYGYNQYLGAGRINVDSLIKPAKTALFADAAQINTFQSPASLHNPKIEEWYFLNVGTPANGHFLHSGNANVVFCDQHVAPEKMATDSLDMKLPAEMVGQLRPEILYLTNSPSIP